MKKMKKLLSLALSATLLTTSTATTLVNYTASAANDTSSKTEVYSLYDFENMTNEELTNSVSNASDKGLNISADAQITTEIYTAASADDKFIGAGNKALKISADKGYGWPLAGISLAMDGNKLTNASSIVLKVATPEYAGSNGMYFQLLMKDGSVYTIKNGADGSFAGNISTWDGTKWGERDCGAYNDGVKYVSPWNGVWVKIPLNADKMTRVKGDSTSFDKTQIAGLIIAGQSGIISDTMSLYIDEVYAVMTDKNNADFEILPPTGGDVFYDFENMTFEDLSALKLDALPLYVDNGSEVAKSYWTAEYVENGVKIWANVIDSNISIDSNAMHLSDNVEFQIQAVENHLQTDGYTVNMLCNVEGNNWLRRWSTGTGWVNEEVTVDLTSENDSVYYLYEQTATGYKVEFFMSYDMLNVTAEEAMGNVRILPMLRNRTNSYFNSYSPLDLLGSHHDYPSTWFVLDENNQFTRKDSERFTLKSVSEESENMISNLAEISSDYGIYTAEFGAPIFDVNSIWGLDGLARELYGTDYVRGPKTGGQTVTIEKSGYVIVLCSRANTAMLGQLAQDNWILLTDKAKCAISVTANTNKSFQYLNAYYGKYFEAGESFTVSGEYAVVFAKAAETPEDFTWKTTSAYISFEDVHDEYYSAEKNIFNALPGIAVSNGGRLFATYVTGGTFEPDGENSTVVVYSDDNGTTWNKAFVIDSWLNQEIGGDKENVVLEADLRVDSSTNKLYVMYNYRMNNDGEHVMNISPWLFTVDNIDKDITKWDVSEQIQTGLEGHVRNTFTILSDGRFAIIPDNCLNSEPNIIYFSSDKGKTWIPGGEVYVPQALNYDEPVLVEKTDGSLWAMFRTTRGAIYESFSYDGGATWTIAQRTDIQNPCSRFNIARLASGNLVMIYNDSTSDRLGMMAAVSTDDGKTWTNKLCLYDGHSSYPAIAVRNENGEDRIHVIFDDGRYYGNNWRANEDNTVQYYSSIYHYSFTESELLAGGDPNDNELEFLALGDSYTDYYWGGFKNSFGTYGGETIGISGTQVADWNNDDKISEVVAKKPQRIFINLGINDLRRGSTGAAVGEELVSYLEVLKQNLPDTDIYYNMIVYTPNTSNIYGQISISNDIVASYIDKNADDNVHKIDVREKLMINGEVDAAKFSDGLHMLAEGYNILCEAIKDATGIGIPINELNTITCAQMKVYFDFDTVLYDFENMTNEELSNIVSNAADKGFFISSEASVSTEIYTATSTADKLVGKGNKALKISANGSYNWPPAGVSLSIDANKLTNASSIVLKVATPENAGSNGMYFQLLMKDGSVYTIKNGEDGSITGNISTWDGTKWVERDCGEWNDSFKYVSPWEAVWVKIPLNAEKMTRVKGDSTSFDKTQIAGLIIAGQNGIISDTMSLYIDEIYVVNSDDKSNHDVNGDGTVNATDLTVLRQALLNDETDVTKYDVNGDKVVDVRDLVRLEKIIAGII